MIYDDQLDEGTWRRDINSNDCIDCLLLLTMTMKTDLYKNPVSPRRRLYLARARICNQPVLDLSQVLSPYLPGISENFPKCISGIDHKWSRSHGNVEVLRRANMSSIEATLMDSQLRWTGHISRMNDSRLPKDVFCEELANGNVFVRCLLVCPRLIRDDFCYD